MLKLINYILFFSLSFSSFSQKKWNFLIADILQFRDEINAQYKDSVHSPLTKAARDQFTTLPFFSIDTNYYIRVLIKRIIHIAPTRMDILVRFPKKKIHSKLISKRVWNIPTKIIKSIIIAMPMNFCSTQ